MADSLDTKTEGPITIGVAKGSTYEPGPRHPLRQVTEAECTQDEVRRAGGVVQGVKEIPARLLDSSPTTPGSGGP